MGLLQHSGLRELSESAELPTPHGRFRIRVVADHEGREHVLLTKGEMEDAEDLPVRVHSECLTSEVFHSLRCDCREQLQAALDYFESAGRGLLIYLRQEGRGIGLLNKIEAYALQDGGLDTVEANVQLGLPEDSRTYDVAAEVLRDILGVRSIRLLTNNPLKLQALEQHGIVVNGRVPLHMAPNSHNSEYIRVKFDKMQHMP